MMDYLYIPLGGNRKGKRHTYLNLWIVCFLSGFYAVIIEFFLLPLKLNAERKMNEEMDSDYEEIS